MRIYYLNHNLSERTGAGRFCLELLEALKKQIPDFEYRILTHDNFLPKSLWQLPWFFLKIRKIFKQYDIIHALDGWPYGVIAALAILGLNRSQQPEHTRMTRTGEQMNRPQQSNQQFGSFGSNSDSSGRVNRPKLIITAIGTGAVQPLYNFWKRPLLKWAYRKADAVTAVSHNTKREIQKILPDLKIEVINHGVDFEKYATSMNRPQQPEHTRMTRTGEQMNRPQQSNQQFGSFGSNSDSSGRIQQLKPYILSVGALKKRKGYEYSIKAFAEIAPQFPDLKYIIVGEGPEYQNLKFKIENLKLNNKVVFFNNLSEQELISLYQNAELFILLPQDVNKDIEGFGLVFLEAAAAGLPVIAVKESSAEDAVCWQPTPTTRTFPNDPNRRANEPTPTTRTFPNDPNTKIIEKDLSYKLGKIFFEIHDELGRFCRERQYADALAEKLSGRGISFTRELPIKTANRKSNFADFLIENRILVELKVKPFIEKQDYYQILRYLEILDIELGLLVNFRDRYLKPKRVLNANLNRPQQPEHTRMTRTGEQMNRPQQSNQQFGSFGSNSDSSGRINGILVPLQDYQEAARAIEKILSDRKLRESMSRNAKEFAAGRTWNKVASQYLHIYNTLV
jgi:GxxExxY protein